MYTLMVPKAPTEAQSAAAEPMFDFLVDPLGSKMHRALGLDRAVRNIHLS